MDKLDQVKATLDALADVRDDAQSKIINAIRELEVALKQAIGNSALRGLPNLNDRETKVYGLVVRSPRKFKLRWPDPGERALSLVLRPEGDLVIVAVTSTLVNDDEEDLDVLVRPVRDDEFLVSDLRAVVETVEQAVRMHLTKIDSTQANWQSASMLADRLLSVLRS